MPEDSPSEIQGKADTRGEAGNVQSNVSPSKEKDGTSQSSSPDKPSLHSSPTRARVSTTRNQHGEQSLEQQIQELYKSIDSVQNAVLNRSFIDGKYFHGFMYATILAQSLTMGLASETEETFGSMWANIELCFTFIYFVEMCIKLYVLRRHYFHDHFNKLDFFLVWFAIIDTWIIVPSGRASNLLSMLRAIRLCRMARLLRESKQLWAVICGIFSAFRAMFWLGVLLVLILYICGILCTIGIGRGGKDLYPAYDEMNVESWEIVQEFNSYQYFGSLGRSVFTLFCIAILAEWPEIGRPVFEYQPAMIILFLVFIIVMTFGIMNVFIGVIVDSTMASFQSLAKEKEVEEHKRKLKTLQKIQEKVFKLDEDHSGSLSFEEMATGLHTVNEELGLPPFFGAQRVIDLLNVDGDDEITNDTFQKVFSVILSNESFSNFCMLLAGINSTKHDVKDIMDKIDALGQHIEGIDQRLKSVEEKGLVTKAATGGTSSNPLSGLSESEVVTDAENQSTLYPDTGEKAIDVSMAAPAAQTISHLEGRLAEKDQLMNQVLNLLDDILKSQGANGHANGAKASLLRSLSEASSSRPATTKVLDPIRESQGDQGMEQEADGIPSRNDSSPSRQMDGLKPLRIDSPNFRSALMSIQSAATAYSHERLVELVNVALASQSSKGTYAKDAWRSLCSYSQNGQLFLYTPEECSSEFLHQFLMAVMPSLLFSGRIVDTSYTLEQFTTSETSFEL